MYAFWFGFACDSKIYVYIKSILGIFEDMSRILGVYHVNILKTNKIDETVMHFERFKSEQPVKRNILATQFCASTTK